MGKLESELFRSMAEQKGIVDPLTEIKRGEKSSVAVYGIELEKRDGPNGTIYTEEDFTDFSLDGKSLEIMGTLANALRLRQPVLLEGETDIGKTKAIEFLSFLTNTRLLRISMSGQTDVNELIGKFVPVGGRQGFEWSDGVVPLAMQWNEGEGCWLYLNRLGSTLPKVLVKLYPAFERNPRLEITEGAGEYRIEKVVTAGPNFRVIASTNPADYPDRTPLAPNLLRRFNYSVISGLTEEELANRLSFLFRNESRATEIARALAEFHFKAVRLLEEERIGRDQRQPIRFTFSDLVRVKRHFSGSLNPDLLEVLKETVSLYYCGKLARRDERRMLGEEFIKAVASLHGIEEQTRRQVKVALPPSEVKAWSLKVREEKLDLEEQLRLINTLLVGLPSEWRQNLNLQEGAAANHQQRTEKGEGKEKEEGFSSIIFLSGGETKILRVAYPDDKMREKFPPDKYIGLETGGNKLWFPKEVAERLGWLDAASEEDEQRGIYLKYSPAKVSCLKVPDWVTYQLQVDLMHSIKGIKISLPAVVESLPKCAILVSGEKIVSVPWTTASETGWLKQTENVSSPLLGLIGKYGQYWAGKEPPFQKEAIGSTDFLVSEYGITEEELKTSLETRKAVFDKVLIDLFGMEKMSKERVLKMAQILYQTLLTLREVGEWKSLDEAFNENTGVDFEELGFPPFVSRATVRVILKDLESRGITEETLREKIQKKVNIPEVLTLLADMVEGKTTLNEKEFTRLSGILSNEYTKRKELTARQARSLKTLVDFAKERGIKI